MIKCGTDIVHIERLAQLNPKIRARFIQRVFTSAEQSQAKNDDQALCGLFAVKEAVSKALGTGIGIIAWREIEVTHLQSGEPILHLHGNAAKIAGEKGLTDWAISISHDAGIAIAFVIALSCDLSDLAKKD